MPRIEIRKGAKNRKSDSPNANFVADICNHCYHEVRLQHLGVGDVVPDDLIECVDEIEIGDELASLDVDHPPYEADPTMCCMCDDTLLEEDNLVNDAAFAEPGEYYEDEDYDLDDDDEEDDDDEFDEDLVSDERDDEDDEEEEDEDDEEEEDEDE